MGRDAPRSQPAAQASSDLADQLERITPRLDALTYRARLGHDLHDLEEAAQAIARDLVASFRGRPAANPPLRISADGTKAVW